MVFAIAALSLDLILGYGGMVSFGHAAYLGIGGYAVAILSHYDVSNGFLHFGVAIVASAAVAFVIGAICLRTSGVYFIMITLAFCQMLYFLGISIEEFGGDDGINTQPQRFRQPDSTSSDSTTLYYFILAFLRGLPLSALPPGQFALRHGHPRHQFQRAPHEGARLRDLPLQAAGLRHRRRGVRRRRRAAGQSDAVRDARPSCAGSARARSWSWSCWAAWARCSGRSLGAAVFLLLEEYARGADRALEIIFGPFLVLLVLFARRGIYGLVPERSGRTWLSRCSSSTG